MNVLLLIVSALFLFIVSSPVVAQQYVDYGCNCCMYSVSVFQILYAANATGVNVETALGDICQTMYSYPYSSDKPQPCAYVFCNEETYYQIVAPDAGAAFLNVFSNHSAYNVCSTTLQLCAPGFLDAVPLLTCAQCSAITTFMYNDAIGSALAIYKQMAPQWSAADACTGQGTYATPQPTILDTYFSGDEFICFQWMSAYFVELWQWAQLTHGGSCPDTVPCTP